MSTEIKSPTYPESVSDGTIANWVKKEGQVVKQDELIAEIETDKIVLEGKRNIDCAKKYSAFFPKKTS